MKTDIYQSCLSIIQHLFVFEMRAKTNRRMKLSSEVFLQWDRELKTAKTNQISGIDLIAKR